MTGKMQQIEQEELRVARPIMIRAFSILAAVAALAVSAAPVASAYEFEECMVSGVKAAAPKPPQSSHTLKDCMISGFHGLKARSDEGQRAKKGHRPNKGQGTVTAMWDLASTKG